MRIKLSELKKIIREEVEQSFKAGQFAFSQGFKAGQKDAQEGQFRKTRNPYERSRPAKSQELRKLAIDFKGWNEGYESGYRWSEPGPP
jgi:hypothetical protein